MPPFGTAALLVQAPALLERAVGYTRTSLMLVAAEHLASPTPCAGWDLVDLLRHMDDSLAAFTEAAQIGGVSDVPVGAPRDAAALVESLRTRACSLIGAWSAEPAFAGSSVAGRAVPARLLAATGALEITVHGWDVAVACGAPRPVPEELAESLLTVAGLVVAAPDRVTRFAEPIAVAPDADASTRLLALLGRRA